MPDIIYTLTFRQRHTGLAEELEFTDAAAAWDAFRCYAEPDSCEIYTSVALSETDFNEHTERLLATLAFPA